MISTDETGNEIFLDEIPPTPTGSWAIRPSAESTLGGVQDAKARDFVEFR